MKTLETNVDAINMNKIDSAFDIDPLFHKMSKTFDEGGARGMLLANLGVSPEGPQIVFDSKADSVDKETGLAAMVAEPEPESESEVEVEDADNKNNNNNAYVLDEAINIGGLNRKLSSLLGNGNLGSLSLVPQLQELRHEYADLKAGGYTDMKVAARSDKYSGNKEEEQKVSEREREGVGGGSKRDELEA